MNVLGIDYGTEHIGIALGDSESGLAEPLATLSTSQHPQSTIATFISRHRIATLIVGVSEKSSEEQARQFANGLKETLNLPIHLVDETLSSREATLKLLHKSRTKRSSVQHAAAAAVILGRWLDAQI